MCIFVFGGRAVTVPVAGSTCSAVIVPVAGSTCSAVTVPVAGSTCKRRSDVDERLVGYAKLLALFAVQFVVTQCLFRLTVNTAGMSHIKKRYIMLQSGCLTLDIHLCTDWYSL